MPNRANIAELVGLLSEESPAGFAIALHIRFTSPTFLFQTYPAEWNEEYTVRGLHLRDPSVIWGFSNSGVIRWGDLESQDPDGVVAGARRHGMTYGFAWATERGGTRSIAGISRADRDFTEDEMSRIAEILTQIHDLTAGGEGLSEADKSALKAMSVRMTHK